MDKIIFENLPSTDTPISDENLNLMQNNIEKSVVAIGTSQPSTNESVWIKKGKNLLDKDNGFKRAYISSAGVFTEDDKNGLFNYIKINPSTSYVLSVNSSVTTLGLAFYDINYSFISRSQQSSDSSLIATSPSNAKYVRVYFNYDASSNITQAIVDNLNMQLEQNTTATTYQDYVNKKIMIKNDNNVFEDFFDVDNYAIETIENSNGIAIKLADGTLIQYGANNLTTGSTPYSSGFTHYGVNADITLPTSFFDTNYTVVANANAPIDYISIVNTNRSSANIFNIRYISSQVNYQRLIYWVAIGRWK